MDSMNIGKERIKDIRRLREPRERSEKGLFIIEGVHLLEEAVKEGVSIRELFYTARFEDTGAGSRMLSSLRKMHVPMHQISENTMESISDTESPQGVLAVVKQPEHTLDDLLKGKGPLIIACGLQDPGNMGTIIRTADAGGVSGVIATQNSVDVYNPKAIRATMGSIFRVPVVKVEYLNDVLSDLRKNGYQIAATTAKTKTSYLDADYRKPTAFLIGQEASGLSKELIESADIKIFIPMREGVESLNAAVSASILIYEVVRQRLMQHS